MAAARQNPRRENEQIKEWGDRIKREIETAPMWSAPQTSTDAANVRITPLYMMSTAPLGAQTYTSANLGLATHGGTA